MGLGMVKIPDHPAALPWAAGIALGVTHSWSSIEMLDPQLHSGTMCTRLAARSIPAKDPCAPRIINSPDTKTSEGTR